MDNSLFTGSDFTTPISLQGGQTIFISYFPTALADTFASLLSLTATFAFLVILWFTKFYKQQLLTMVFFLLFADFTVSFAFFSVLIFSPSSTSECKMVFFISFFGRNSSLFWSVSFAHALKTAVESKDFSPAARLMRYYYIFAAYLPIIISLVVVLSPLVVYNPDLQKCGRYETVGQFDYTYFLLSGMPLLLSCLLSIYFYLRTGCRLKTLFNGTAAKTRDALVLVLYPAIMIICWGPNLVWSLLSMAKTLDPALLVFPKVCLAMHGFLNSLVYGLTQKTRQDLKVLCCSKHAPAQEEITQRMLSMIPDPIDHDANVDDEAKYIDTNV